jgi:hypothetical protein
MNQRTDQELRPCSTKEPIRTRISSAQSRYARQAETPYSESLDLSREVTTVPPATSTTNHTVQRSSSLGNAFPDIVKTMHQTQKERLRQEFLDQMEKQFSIACMKEENPLMLVGKNFNLTER